MSAGRDRLLCFGTDDAIDALAAIAHRSLCRARFASPTAPEASIARAMQDALALLRRERPTCIVAVGESSSVPILIAARLQRVRSLCIAPDVLGRASTRAANVCAHLATAVVVRDSGGLACHPRAATIDAIDALIRPVAGGPFARHPTRRYAFAFDHTRERDGRMLDLGCAHGIFLVPTARADCALVAGADVSAQYLSAIRSGTDVPLVRLGRTEALPFRSAAFRRLTLLDVLEHVADERHTLGEAHRVLETAGLLVCTVPHQHALSFLDPDDAKLRYARLHRIVYAARFGADVYRERFVDVADGMRGDLDVERPRHTNYDAADLLDLLSESGFEPVLRDGANLLGRQLDALTRLSPERLRPALDDWQRRDAKHHSANLFVIARRR